jgi:hypothetical protein
VIINILYGAGLVAIGYAIRQIQEDFKRIRDLRKQDRVDQEVARMTSGWSQEPEVPVDTEKIRPSFRERLADWWAQTWASSEPRGMAIAGSGFRSTSTRAFRAEDRPSRAYQGLHRAPEELDQDKE